MNLIPFDIEKAKEHPDRVVYEDGTPARIICWDQKLTSGENQLVILLWREHSKCESIFTANLDGVLANNRKLCLIQKTCEVWANLYKSYDCETEEPNVNWIWIGNTYNTKEDAMSEIVKYTTDKDTSNIICVKTFKVSWEE